MNKVDKTICTMCGRKSWLISEEQACGKTFQMTYEREDASLSLSCSKLSKDWISVDDDGLPDEYDIYLVCGWKNTLRSMVFLEIYGDETT